MWQEAPKLSYVGIGRLNLCIGTFRRLWKTNLCSMGGLLTADSLLELARSLRSGKSDALWPRIVACISFDTPVRSNSFSDSRPPSSTLRTQYLGLHPSVFKGGVTKAAEVVNTAQTIGSTVFGALAGLSAGKAAEMASPPSPQTSQTGWTSWAAPAAYAVGGAVLASAVGSAWYKNLGQGYQWATDHMKFVGNLWDESASQKRIDDLVALEKSHGILFRT